MIDPESGILYPRLIEAKGHCPPEDIGGPWGYGEFVEAIADPSHERHRELKEWFADDFNPHVVDVDWLSQALWHDLGSFDFQIAGFGKLKRRNLAAEQALNDTLEWFADDFNPHVVDVDWLSQALWHDLGSFDFQIAGFGKLKRRNLAAEQALNDTLPTCWRAQPSEDACTARAMQLHRIEPYLHPKALGMVRHRQAVWSQHS